MNQNKNLTASHKLVDGFVRIFMAECLVIPTGLFVTIYLTRKFGPSNFGLFTLSASLIAWVEWTLASMMAKASVKFISETKDWRQVAGMILRIHLVLGLCAGALIWFFSPIIANILQDEKIVRYLRIYSIDIPIFVMAYGYRNILIGVGRLRQRAISSASRWIARALLIVLFVEFGLSIEGAIIGSIAATAIELMINITFVRTPFWAKSRLSPWKLFSYATPLFLFAMVMRFYDKLDLFALKTFGGTIGEAGIYGAAQNLTFIFPMIAISFILPLFSTLNRVKTQEGIESARYIAKNAIRFVFCLLPVAAIAAFSSGEVIQLIFGTPFLPAANVFSILIFAGLALLIISVTTAVLIAAEKPVWTFYLTIPLLPLSFVGYMWFVPHYRGMGAASVMTAVAWFGAILSLCAANHVWKVRPEVGTLVRSIAVSVVVGCLSYIIPAVGWFVVVELILLGLLVIVFYIGLKEIGKTEIRLFQSIFIRPEDNR